ncbi:hypothetical protein MAH1_31510 [Sessilibacter sp. MAH1]
MKSKPLLTAALLGLGVTGSIGAQANIINLNASASAEQLAANLFTNSLGAVSISNVNYTGDVLQSGIFSTDGNTFLDDLGLSSGIVLSTGSVFDAVSTTNTSNRISTNFGNAGSDLVSNVSGRSSSDGVTLSFNFEIDNIDTAGEFFFPTIDIDVVFASDEYQFFNGQGFSEPNDLAVISIDGGNFFGDALSVDRINRQGDLANLFNSNLNEDAAIGTGLDGGFATEADGFSDLISFSQVLFDSTSSTHTLEISIADAGLFGSGDSFIFLAINSPDLPTVTRPPVAVPELNAKSGSIVAFLLVGLLLLRSESSRRKSTLSTQFA